jgi:hypothetical protein
MASSTHKKMIKVYVKIFPEKPLSKLDHTLWFSKHLPHATFLASPHCLERCRMVDARSVRKIPLVIMLFDAVTRTELETM